MLVLLQKLSSNKKLNSYLKPFLKVIQEILFAS